MPSNGTIGIGLQKSLGSMLFMAIICCRPVAIILLLGHLLRIGASANLMYELLVLEAVVSQHHRLYGKCSFIPSTAIDDTYPRPAAIATSLRLQCS